MAKSSAMEHRMAIPGQGAMSQHDWNFLCSATAAPWATALCTASEVAVRYWRRGGTRLPRRRPHPCGPSDAPDCCPVIMQRAVRRKAPAGSSVRLSPMRQGRRCRAAQSPRARCQRLCAVPSGRQPLQPPPFLAISCLSSLPGRPGDAVAVSMDRSLPLKGCKGQIGRQDSAAGKAAGQSVLSPAVELERTAGTSNAPIAIRRLSSVFAHCPPASFFGTSSSAHVSAHRQQTIGNPS